MTKYLVYINTHFCKLDRLNFLTFYSGTLKWPGYQKGTLHYKCFIRLTQRLEMFSSVKRSSLLNQSVNYFPHQQRIKLTH
jgi:hypothetical protein